jgi:hypothetical protein
MNRTIIYFIALCLFFASCKKEAGLKASPDEADPFARIDNAGNAADHQIYLFYKDSGIPVLYSDTVAKNPLKLLNLGYHLTSLDTAVMAKYSTNQTDIIAGLNFIKSQIVPYLGSTLKPYSILLTDSVYTFVPDPSGPGLVKSPLNAYVGLNTLAISYISEISTMDQARVKKFRNDILKNILTAKINADLVLFNKFSSVSSAFYNKTAYGTTSNRYQVPFVPKGNYGLLVDGTEQPTYYSITGPAEDLANYLDTILSVSAADFLNANQSYPLVMQKYNLLLDFFKTVGFKVPQ